LKNSLPGHLKKYVVEQHYEKYTSVDQAVWRYILRQLKSFLSKHAHESYLEGLEKSGIEVDRIPRISDISAKIEKFGWQALPVSGFIPPAAFMELQSLGFLPIASAMRSLDHLTYTPAPDIVHEAAGHAPILIQAEFAKYLKDYAQVARKAIISKEDLDVYEAIRILSDIKESPTSTTEQIDQAQAHLEKTLESVTHISEATELSRMNWWTAEYGLIGDIKHPKIFGAGLLSSVGESKWCLSDKVAKVPLSLDCIKTTYDITEPQPQLFVAHDFKQLSSVLHQLAETMAFKTGGIGALKKSRLAQTVNTVELETGLQISGILEEYLKDDSGKHAIYLRFNGPTQISYQYRQLDGHGKDYHLHGFGTALGEIKNFDPEQIKKEKSHVIRLEYSSGVIVKGVLKDYLEKDGKLLMLSFQDCSVRFHDRILFQPEWGIYDLALGQKVVSVYGGPADRKSYGEIDDFVALQVPMPKYSDSELTKFKNYQKIRDLRDKKVSGNELEESLTKILVDHFAEFPKDWLLWIEAYELVLARAPKSETKVMIFEKLTELKSADERAAALINDGIVLAGQEI
jgi:phenylalanine-4-hydroxylase